MGVTLVLGYNARALTMCLCSLDGSIPRKADTCLAVGSHQYHSSDVMGLSIVFLHTNVEELDITHYRIIA